MHPHSKRFLTGSGIALVIVMAVILLVQAVSNEPSASGGAIEKSLAQATEVASVVSPTHTAFETVTITATASPDQSISIEEINQVVLDYLVITDAVRSGEPAIIYSSAVGQQQLIGLGLARIPYAPGCTRPMHLVIVHGDFDIRYLAPGFLNQPPMPYIGFVFDLEAGTFSQIMPSEDGSIFRLALNDPTLPTPDPEEVAPPEQGDSWVPCETVEAPVGPEPPDESTPSSQ